MRVVITGANGNIGRRLINRLSEQEGTEIVALVRSERAAAQVEKEDCGVDIRIVDYNNAREISNAVGTCDVVIHLVGIIKESKDNPFHLAHEAACQALVDAGLNASQILVLGIVGTHLNSSNACLKSRAEAEKILQSGASRVTCLRVPMVLGEGDYASWALKNNATSRLVLSFRPSSLEQPVDSEDVLAALLACLTLPPAHRCLDLAGPECISRRDLIYRAGQLFGRKPMVVPLPVSLGYLMAAIFEAFMANPPVTRAMLGVLDHDDEIDPAPACEALGLELTALETTLKRIML